MNLKRTFVYSCFLCLAGFCSAQTVVPFMGLGSAQWFDNNGKLLTSGALYSFQAGTSTQQATYVDSTGTAQNPNPIPFGSGARVSIWLSVGSFYKFVLCAQNDGPVCAAGDVLFSVDQVPAGSTGGSSGGGSSPFTGTFISGTVSPATSGILRLASTDCIAWLNAAGSGNLFLCKDTSDVLSWSGGSMKFPEIACANTGANFDYLCASSANHRWMMANNGGGQKQIVGAGVDINTSDQVTQLHFGATPIPLTGTAPSGAGQVFCWNGSGMTACNPVEQVISWGLPSTISSTSTCALTGVTACVITAFASGHNILRFTYTLTTAPAGCVVVPVYGIRNLSNSTNLFTTTLPNGGAAGQFDSGALSIPMATSFPYWIGVGLITNGTGCTTWPTISVSMVYQ